MLKADPATLRKALEQLEQATDDYTEWHEKLLLAVFCGSPRNPDDLRTDAPRALAAIRSCRFYISRHAVIRHTPSPHTIGSHSRQ